MGRLPNSKEIVWSKFVILSNGCWQWTGGVRPNRYGRQRVNNVTYQVHRLAYELAVGPIPDGLHLDHLCRNTLCINPLHLEPVTCRENLMRGIGPASVNSKKTHCNHGHPFDEINTSIKRNGHRRCRACERLRREAWRRRRGQPPFTRRLYCSCNHPLFGSEAQISVMKDGTRRCNICRNNRRREIYRNKKKTHERSNHHNG